MTRCFDVSWIHVDFLNIPAKLPMWGGWPRNLFSSCHWPQRFATTNIPPHNMQRCQRLLQFRPPLTRCNTTQAKSQSLLQPVAADMIGTPDPVTNLRPVRYYVPPDETQEVHDQKILVVKVLSFWWYELGERVAITTRTSGRIQPKLLEEEQYHVYWSKSRIWREM